MGELSLSAMQRLADQTGMVLEEYTLKQAVLGRYAFYLKFNTRDEQAVRAALCCARNTLKICKSPRECIKAIEYLQDRKAIPISQLFHLSGFRVPEKKLDGVRVALLMAFEHMTDRREPSDVLRHMRSLLRQADNCLELWLEARRDVW